MMGQGVFTVGNLMSWFLRLSLRGVSNREKMRLVPAWRAIFALRTALHDWLLAIVSKCKFILPLVDSILKRG